MDPSKKRYLMGLVGAGQRGMSILNALVPPRKADQGLQILGVADRNQDAPGMQYASRHNLFVTGNASDLLQLPELNIVVNATGNPEVTQELKRRQPERVMIDLDHWDRVYQQEDLLYSMIENEIRFASQRTWFQQIFDHLPDPVLVLTPNYLVEDANLTFLKRFKKASKDVIGKYCYEVFHQYNEPCDHLGLHCPLPRVMDECQTTQIIQGYKDSEGNQRYDEVTMSPLCPPENSKKRIIEVIKDITLRKKLEEALKTSEKTTRQLLKQTKKDKAFLETIVNGIEDHMMVIDLDYRVIDVNKALLEMVGLRKQELLGKHCYEISHHLKTQCDSPHHPCPLKDAVATGKAASATHVHFDKNGREHFIQVACHPLFDEAGQINRVIDLSRDITQEIMARTRMLHDDKMTSLGKLSASVVHEINNPLTGILNFAKLAKRSLAKEAVEEAELGRISNYLDMISSETSRVSKTVANLLTFSRKTTPEFMPVNLNAILDETLSLSEYQLRLQGITIKRSLNPNLLPVLADPGQLKQAFLNLLLNAQDAMPQGGTLTLETKNTKSKKILFRISDTGVGISEENFSKIFEPFYTTKKVGSGVGLGLSVVYGIIRDHKGTIKVDSVVGQGTTFTVKLPAHKPGEESAASQKS